MLAGEKSGPSKKSSSISKKVDVDIEQAYIGSETGSETRGSDTVDGQAFTHSAMVTPWEQSRTAADDRQRDASNRHWSMASLPIQKMDPVA